MIVRYQHPFASFRHFDREFEHLVRRGFGRAATQYTIRADVYTEGEDAVIALAVPGVDAQDVSVSLEGRRLSVTAERRQREVAEGDRYLARGLVPGRFRREFTVPEGTEASQLSAELADGLLTVRVSGAVQPAPEAQEIPVTTAQPVIDAEETDENE